MRILDAIENDLAFHPGVVVDNDANAQAWGEYIYGAGRGSGHMIVETSGKAVCSCGNRGCLMSMASGNDCESGLCREIIREFGTYIGIGLYNIFQILNPERVVLGGMYQEESESLVGPMTRKALGDIGYSKAFLGATGFTPEIGFTLNDFSRAEISQEILSHGRENFILTDSLKFGERHIAPIGTGSGRVHTVITDSGISDDYRHFLENEGIVVVTSLLS